MPQEWTYDVDIIITITCKCKRIIRYEEPIGNREEVSYTCPYCGNIYIINNFYTEVGIEVTNKP